MTDLVEAVAQAILSHNPTWKDATVEARAALAAIEAAGWRVVPAEPTAEMWNGWISVNHEYDLVTQHAYFDGDSGNWHACWDAMLAAAPKVTP
jgi:hypothetical protein